MTFAATILTLFPEMFPGSLGISLAGKALNDGLWSLDIRDIRASTTDKHRTVDDHPGRRRRRHGAETRYSGRKPSTPPPMWARACS